jgi:hypothetical protein
LIASIHACKVGALVAILVVDLKTSGVVSSVGLAGLIVTAFCACAPNETRRRIGHRRNRLNIDDPFQAANADVIGVPVAHLTPGLFIEQYRQPIGHAATYGIAV